MSTVIIIGGHGKVALLLAPLLTEAGHTVRSWIRNPEHVAEVEQSGAEAIVADLEIMSAEDMAGLLRECEADAIVWSAGAGGGDPARTRAVDRDAALRSMEASVIAGVRRYVMVSYFGAGPDHGVSQDNPFFHYAQAKTEADGALAETQLDWTILRPSALTLDEPTGRIETGPDVTASEVSRANVAAVAAAALDTPQTIGRTIAFNDGDTPIAQALSTDAG
ncbi:MAG: SDR family oxidoreductase [Actinomycetia bacterium]|nr:SDR family oxidoreductase [Actinomycetes bacterium]MDO5502853.1 SDR family oxidoreductase [Actinomycetes bacterium]